MQLLAFTFVLLIIGICHAATSTYDGKPGCKTDSEIGQSYRNFWDPMRYWRCIGLNMEPLQQSCPDGTGFQQTLGRCVYWIAWRWETPRYPPSCPDGVTCLSNDLTPLLTGTNPSQSSIVSHAFAPSEMLGTAWPLPQPQSSVYPQSLVQPQSLAQPQSLVNPRPLQLSPTRPLPALQPLLPNRPQPLPYSQVLGAARPLTSSGPLSPADPYI